MTNLTIPEGQTTIEDPNQASSNFYWTYDTDMGAFNLQTTVRGVLDAEQIREHIKTLLEAVAHVASLGGQAKQVGAGAKQASAPATPQAASLPNEPVNVPVEQGNWFDAELLSVSITNGKQYFKVKGGNYKKYGVTIWPEVIEAAGISAHALEAREYNMIGWRASYTTKEDGKPDKVTKLEKAA